MRSIQIWITVEMRVREKNKIFIVCNLKHPKG